MKKHIGLPERFLLLCILITVIGRCIFGLSILKICGTSMESTLVNGDYVLAVTVHDCTELRRDDVITFYPSLGSQDIYVKRVAGVPGDILEARGDLLFVNGKSDGYSQTGTGAWGPITVPQNTVFVLGDNRAVSLDSRSIGCIPFRQVCAKIIGENLSLSEIIRK